MVICLPVLMAGKETHSVETFLGSILTSIPRSFRHHQSRASLVVWDTQTGVIIGKTDSWHLGKIMFHGDQRTITVIPQNRHFYTYDIFNCVQLCQGEILSPWGSGVGAHWTHNNGLQFAMSFEANGKLMINIYELQPTLTPPLSIFSSFPTLPQSRKFSFSSASFHASFFYKGTVNVINVQDSKSLLQTKVAQAYHPPPGQFSPDGQFFACGISEQEICTWQNTPTGYMPWSSLKPRLLFREFSWSPTSISILAWSSGGIQLLHPDNCLGPLSPSKVKPHHLDRSHLVAYSTDGIHIATAWQGGRDITVFNQNLGTVQRLSQMGMRIQDIKIFNNAIFAVDAYRLTRLDLGAGRITHSIHGSRRAAVSEMLAISDAEHLKLSNDCSQIAYIREKGVFLYDVKAQKVLKSTRWKISEHVCLRFTESLHEESPTKQVWISPDHHRAFEDYWFSIGQDIEDQLHYSQSDCVYVYLHRLVCVHKSVWLTLSMHQLEHQPMNHIPLHHEHHMAVPVEVWFSPSGKQLWFTTADNMCYCLEIDKDWECAGVTQESLEDAWLLFNPSFHEYTVEVGSAWLVDSRGRKLLWLPPNWRAVSQFNVRWNGNFLALLHNQHPEPIIIELQS